MEKNPERARLNLLASVAQKSEAASKNPVISLPRRSWIESSMPPTRRKISLIAAAAAPVTRPQTDEASAQKAARAVATAVRNVSQTALAAEKKSPSATETLNLRTSQTAEAPAKKSARELDANSWTRAPRAEKLLATRGRTLARNRS